jgi:hypothetical protein
MSTVAKRGRSFVRASMRQAAKFQQGGSAGQLRQDHMTSDRRPAISGNSSNTAEPKQQKKVRSDDHDSMPALIQRELDTQRVQKKEFVRNTRKLTPSGSFRRSFCFVDPPKVRFMHTPVSNQESNCYPTSRYGDDKQG